MIALFDKATNKKLALLDDILLEDNVSITRQINGEFTLKFEVLEAELKSRYFESDAYVLVDGFYFDIAYVEQLHSDVLTYRIECEHVTYRLISEEVPYYTFDGTPAAILADILTGTEFQAGQVDLSDVLTFAVYEESNKLGLVKLLANKLGAKIDYDGFKVDLKATVGQDRGFEARFGKNLTGIKKIIDKRNGLTYYSVDIIELKNHPTFADVSALEVIEEGDTIRIVDETMGLDVVNKVIKRTYNPIKEINTTLEIANSIELLTDIVTKIQRDTVAKNKLYHGIRISPDSGFESVRSDNMARGVFNSDTFALQAGDGSGNNWTNKLYFDAATGKYIFDGELSANLISALEAEFDVTVSQTVIVNQLSSQKANIAELTVDQIDTSDKVQRYLSGDTSPLGYWRGYDQFIEFIEAVVPSGTTTTKQVTDRNNALVYWVDETHSGTTLNVTDFPVLQYDYLENVKLKLFHQIDPETGVVVPKMIWGVGDQNGRMKGYIFKDNDSMVIAYENSAGEMREIRLGEAGVYISPYDLEGIAFSEGGFSVTYSGETLDWTWAKDGDGKITQLQIDGRIIPVTWA